jgi:hypothetical protein
LLEHVYAVGQLLGKLKLLEQGLSCPSPDDRKRLAEHLNNLDGEIAVCRHLADRRDLARRINANVEIPLIDGLCVRGLTYILGGKPELRHAFRTLVIGARGAFTGCLMTKRLLP